MTKRKFYPDIAVGSIVVILLLFQFGLFTTSISQTMNGFDISNASVSIDLIKQGGPPRDGIPSIDDPEFIEASQADWLRDDDRILGISYNSITKAYPMRILDWHEVVNDFFGEEPILVTWCPLCGSGMAFKSEIDGEILEFGVSGLLYNSDVLLYDRQTESLWSQISTEAITGVWQGSRLEQIPANHTTWGDWVRRHPDTKVLSRNTGFDRNYNRRPYAGYENREDLYFPLTDTDERYPLKEWVLGITLDGVSRAYAFSELENSENRFEDRIGSHYVIIEYDPENKAARAFDAAVNPLSSITAYWFAWYAFHPDTEVYQISR